MAKRVTHIYYTYIVKCSDGTLYCGYAADIRARVEKHNRGEGAKYTRSRLPVELIYCEEFESKSEAMRRECEIKRLTREEKLDTVAQAAPFCGEGFDLAHWDEREYARLICRLFTMADEKYKDFNSALIPNKEKSGMIGIRIPALRKLAKEISNGNAEEYISLKKGKIQEEVMLEGFVIGYMKLGYPQLSEYVRYFADKVDNWAVSDCTSASMKRIKMYRTEFLRDIEYLISSENPWHIRYGILFLMQYYLDDEYIDYVLNTLESIRSGHYYVKMAQAWCLATALAKFGKKTLGVLERQNFDAEVLNMFIRKARDSARVSKEYKELILKFRG